MMADRDAIDAENLLDVVGDVVEGLWLGGGDSFGSDEGLAGVRTDELAVSHFNNRI
jgi:hypothetical protein